MDTSTSTWARAYLNLCLRGIEDLEKEDEIIIKKEEKSGEDYEVKLAKREDKKYEYKSK